MKFILALFAVLAITGLGQAHQFPNFGEGPLHEDMQDFLDLIPVDKVSAIFLDYFENDPEVQAAIEYLLTSTVLRDLLIDFEAVPQVINLFNYLHKEGIYIYDMINEINRIFDIKELEPPTLYERSSILKRTGGIAGLFKDIEEVLNYADYIHVYANKLRTSQPFVKFINELKSNNFQQLVNKVYNIKSVQIILNGLKSSGVNTQVSADLMYILLGITVPNKDYAERTIQDELMDFYNLLPIDECIDVFVTYMNEDKKLQDAILYMFTPEFQNMLRNVEALKEHQALVIYLEKAGLPVIEGIQMLHETIDMEKYVPPKIERKSLFGVQKIGDGMKGLLKDLYDMLPLDEIDALYKDKLKTSKIFADFIATLTSPQMQKLIDNIYNNKTYKEFVMKTREKGLEFEELTKFITRIFGLQFPSYDRHIMF